MGVIKRGEFYHYRFKARGKLYTGTTGCSKEKDAQKYERDMRKRLHGEANTRAIVEDLQDQLAGGKRMPLDEAFERFLKTPKKRQIQGHHKGVMTGFWEDFLAFVHGRYPEAKFANDITDTIAKAYIQHLRDHGKYQKKIRYRRKHDKTHTEYTSENQQLSPRTVNGYHKALQYIFDVVGEPAGVGANPFKGIPKLDMKGHTEHREAFTPDELKEIGEKADDFILALFAIGTCTGLREGDICTLRWSEVDLNSGWITRRTSKTGSIVTIPILTHLRSFLSALPRDGEHVLPEHARIYQNNPSLISSRVKRFLEKPADKGGLGMTTTRQVAGRHRRVTIKDVHSCRHTFCFMAAQERVPPNIIQSIVGHIDPEITRMYMDHFTADQKRHATASLPDCLGIEARFQTDDGARVLTAEEKLARISALLEGAEDLTEREKEILALA